MKYLIFSCIFQYKCGAIPWRNVIHSRLSAEICGVDQDREITCEVKAVNEAGDSQTASLTQTPSNCEGMVSKIIHNFNRSVLTRRYTFL